MSSFSWDEGEQRVVSTDGSDDESESPSNVAPAVSLVAWETVDDDESEKNQEDHTFDLSALFNFAPRNGNGSGSGYDDQVSLTTFATDTSKLTMNIGPFQDPIFQANEEVVVDDDDASMLPPPVERIPASSPGAASNMSAITPNSFHSLPENSASVASAPLSIKPWSDSPPHPPTTVMGIVPSYLAASVTSLQQTEVYGING